MNVVKVSTVEEKRTTGLLTKFQIFIKNVIIMHNIFSINMKPGLNKCKYRKMEEIDKTQLYIFQNVLTDSIRSKEFRN